jgi:hypothetical protein
MPNKSAVSVPVKNPPHPTQTGPLKPADQHLRRSLALHVWAGSIRHGLPVLGSDRCYQLEGRNEDGGCLVGKGIVIPGKLAWFFGGVG